MDSFSIWGQKNDLLFRLRVQIWGHHVTLGRFCNREGSIPSGCCAFWCPHRGCLGRQHQQGIGRLSSAHRIPQWHLARLAFRQNEVAFSEENFRLKIVQPRFLLPKECCLNISSTTFFCVTFTFSGICHVRIVSMPTSQWWVRLWMLDSAWTAQWIPASLILRSCQKEPVVTRLRSIQSIFVALKTRL